MRNVDDRLLSGRTAFYELRPRHPRRWSPWGREETAERSECVQLPRQGVVRHVTCRRYPHCSLQVSADWFFSELSELLLSKHLGELQTGGKDIHSLGRAPGRDNGSIHLQAPQSYTTEMVDLLGPKGCKPVNTTGASSTTRRENGTCILSAVDHNTYRRVVGKLLWLVPFRPDLSYAAKGLNCTLWSRRRTTLPSSRMSIVPKDIADNDDIVNMATFVDCD